MAEGEQFELEPGGQGDIMGATKFSALYQALRERGGVQGSRKHYPAEELEKRIDAARSAVTAAKERGKFRSDLYGLILREITNGIGEDDKVRDKVKELLEQGVSE